MAKAPLSFPANVGDLAKLPNADLIQLVKQEGIDHPQGKSLAHFMSKEDKVTYLGNVHYGTGAAYGHVIPNAEAKYADFLAKAKAKNEGTKISSGANCSATAMKDLEQAASAFASGSMSKLDVIHGDVTSFFIAHPQLSADATNAGTLQQFVSQLKSLPSEIQLGVDEEKFNALVETLKAARDSVDMLNEPAAGSVAGLLGQAKKLDDIVPIYGEDPIAQGLKILSSETKAQAETKSIDYFVGTPPMKTYMSLGGEFEKDSLGGLISTLNDIGQLEPAHMTEQVIKNADALVKNLTDAITEKLNKYAAEDLKPSVLENVMQGTENVPAKALGDTGTKALQELHDLALEKSQGAAWEANKAEFEALKNVDLKQLAYQELADHGFQKSLGSFLTKDEKVELLAKFKAGQPVDDLVASAKEKYLIKEGKLPAKAEDVISENVAPEAKAVEALADPTKPEFDLLKILDESGEEHLAPAEPIQIEVEPHPAEKVTHVFTPTGTRPDGGSHPMEIFLDENGDKWLFKVQESWQSHVEDWAAQIGEKLGLNVTELRIEEQVSTSFYGTVDGSFQRMLPNVGELGKEGKGVAFKTLSEGQVKDIQRNQVYDWLISNHDTHGENMLMTADGGMAPIDKGQAMKFFGTDSLNPTYSPNNSTPVYNRLWESVIKGEVKVDLNAIDEILTRVEQLSNDQYRELLREKFAEKYATKMRVINAYQSADSRTLDSFIEKAIERKEQIRADFEKFYRDIAKRSGIDWQPSWAADVAKAEKIVDPATKLAVQGDIATPIDKTLAQAVADTHSGGQALHLAGEEINQGQALIWQETAEDGSKILRMELRVESQADARLTATFEDAAGTSMGKIDPNLQPSLADPAFQTVQDAAKTINHHVTKGDFLPNQDKIDKMIELNAKLFDVIDKAAEADVKLAAGEIDPEMWALLKAQGEQAAHYKQVINDLGDAISYQHKAEHVVKFDLDKSKAEWMTKQPLVQPKPTLSEPVKLFEKVGLENERVARTDAGFGYMERVRNGGYRSIDVSASPSSVPAGEVRLQMGKQFEGVMKVGDQEIKTTWSGWNMTSNYGGKSRLSFELKGWDGTEAGIQKMLDALDRLGVDSHLATREEEKLTYWQVTTGQMKQSVEYVNPGQATGNYKGMRDTIDRIEARISAEALDTQGKIDVYRDEWGKQFGQDAVDRAPERIGHIHDLLGREIGYGHFERFDLPDDISSYMLKNGKATGIARKANTSKDTFTMSWGSTGNGEKIRLGMEKAGTSAEADLATGGGTGSFSSMGMTGWQSNGPVAVMNPSSVMRRASSFAANHDNFGRIADRGSENFLNPAEWQRYIGTGTGDNTRELVARNGYSFFDDLELVMARNEGEKDALVKVFDDLGVTELRGIPVADRVVVSTNDKMPGIIDKWYRDHPEAYTHSYTSPTDLTPGKEGVKAAKIEAPPPAPITAAKGTFEAEKQAYVNGIDQWGTTTNSTKAKLDNVTAQLQSAGIKTSVTQVNAEFKAWWDSAGQYKGLSQVKSTKSFMLFKAKEAEINAAIDGVSKAADKITALTTFQNTPAKQQALEKIFGKTFTQLIDDYKAEKPGQGVYGAQFNDWLLQKGIALDATAPAPAVGSFTFEGIGKIDVAKLEQIMQMGSGDLAGSVSLKVDAMAKEIGTDFNTLTAKLNELKSQFGFDGAGSITNTLNKILELAKAPVEKVATEGFQLGSFGTIPKSKLEELLADKVSSASQKVKGIADALGKSDELSDVLQALLDAKGGLGVSGAADTDTVLKAMLDTLAPTPAPAASFVTVPALGDLTTEMATKLQALVDFVGTEGDVPIYASDVANAVGFSSDTTKIVLDAASQEYGLGASSDYINVVKEWLHEADVGGLQFEKAEPSVQSYLAQDIHPSFTASPQPLSTGYAYGVTTPVGFVNGDFMNTLTDAAWEIEHQGTNVIDAMNAVGEKIGQKYGDMLPNLDAYAKDKGLGGFPGSNPADVLKAFVDDMSKSVTKLTSEAKSATEAEKPVTWLLDPKNTALPPTPLWQTTVISDIGKPITSPEAGEKIFSYNVNGQKVPVAFVKVPGGTNIIVQEKGTGQWFLLKPTSAGKTTKDEIIELLGKVQHSAAEPF